MMNVIAHVYEAQLELRCGSLVAPKQPGRAKSRTLTRRKEPSSACCGHTSASSRKGILLKRCGRWHITYTPKNVPSWEDALQDTTGAHLHAVVCSGRTSASVRVSGKRHNFPFPNQLSAVCKDNLINQKPTNDRKPANRHDFRPRTETILADTCFKRDVRTGAIREM